MVIPLHCYGNLRLFQGATGVVTQVCVSAFQDQDEAYADSEATDVILTECLPFLSYRKCKKRFITLGDELRLPIAGVGIAKFSLNGKVIIIRNALHIPGLCNSLYPLPKHVNILGCGTFSHHVAGSCILFPDFVIHIDNKVDNLASNKSIGRQHPPNLAYTQPCASRLSSGKKKPTLISTNNANKPTTPTIVPKQQNEQLQNEQPLSEKKFLAKVKLHLSQLTLKQLHTDPNYMPPIRSSLTSVDCKRRTTFDTLKLNRIFGCRYFKYQEHLAAAFSNATLIHTGELPLKLGLFTTIKNPEAGETMINAAGVLTMLHSFWRLYRSRGVPLCLYPL